MIRSSQTLCAFVIALVALAPLAGQEGQPPQPAEVEVISLDDVEPREINAFAQAYLVVQEVSQSYQGKINQAGDDHEQAAQLQRKANEEIVAAIENQESMDLARYNQIITSISSDQELYNAVIAAIGEIKN